MPESIQVVMIFCLTIVAIIGIISAVVFFSKDRIKFKVNARAGLSHNSQAELDLEVDKQHNEENRQSP